MTFGKHGKCIFYLRWQITNKLTENKENEKPVLAAQTTARRKGNPDMDPKG